MSFRARHPVRWRCGRLWSGAASAAQTNKAYMQKPYQIRQGDVLLVRQTPPDKTKLTRAQPVGSRVILAYGEVTGHHHSLDAAHSQAWVDDAGVTWVEVKEAMELLHQEHAPIPVETGWYRKSIPQREYTPQAVRNIAD